MAKCAALPCVHLGLQRSRYKASDSSPQNLYSKPLQRNHIYGSYNVVKMLPSRRVRTITRFFGVSKKGHWRHKETGCFCLGMMTGPENVAPLQWVSVMDQMLLMTSIVFAYMAGVVPRDSAFFNAPTKTKDYDAGATDSTTSGRYMKGENQTELQDSWTEVNGKLMDALDSIEHDSFSKSGAVDSEYYSTKRPLSLFALAEGPRLRLLLVTLQRLYKEVNNISQVHEFDSRDVWLVCISEALQGSTQPIYVQWLEEELILEHKDQNEKLITKMFEKSKGDDSVSQYIRRTGKLDLYADLLFFFRFGFLSTIFCYDKELLVQHGVEILEDLVITLADGISGIYLELISVDSDLSYDMNGLGLMLCSMSTRALQKLRNEVVLNHWLQQNFESVVSMYEDRFELCILQRKLVEGPSERKTKKSNWWKKLAFRKQAVSSPLHRILVSQLSMPIKRTKELRALAGWRYCFSLFLEFSDIAMPLVRAVVTKVIDAVSFFLVYMIGRSLGLIYTGIRQSLGWR